MLEFLFKWMPPIALVVDSAFSTYCFCVGWKFGGIISALCCVLTFLDLFVVSDYRKK